MKSSPRSRVVKSTDLLKKENVIENLNNNNGNEQNALIKAFQTLKEEMVRKLIENGFDLSKPDHYGNAAADSNSESSTGGMSAKRLEVNIVGDQIFRGANNNFHSEEDGIPLIQAACRDYINIIMKLIDTGINLAFRPRRGKTSLIRILQQASIQEFITIKEEKRLELEQEVENAFADKTINRRNHLGDTVLIRATKLDHFELIKKLLTARVNHRLTNKENKDFYDYIKFKEIKDWVDKHNPRFVTAKQKKIQRAEDAKKFGI